MTIRSPRAALLAMVLVASAHAQDGSVKGGGIAGVWTFETGDIGGGCKLSGRMTIHPAAGDAPMICNFVSVQHCEASGLRLEVEQTCIATQDGRNVAIDSEVVRVISREPRPIFPWQRTNYAPDNFELTLSPGGDEMRGDFWSINEAWAKFVRVRDLTS